MKTLSSKKFANNILVLKWIGRNRLVKIKHISFFLYVRNCEIVIYNHVKNKINPSKFEDLIGFIIIHKSGKILSSKQNNAPEGL